MKTKTISSCLLGALFLAGCTQKSKTLVSLEKLQIAPPPQTISIQMSGYTPALGHNFANLFVQNFSVKAAQGVLSLMSARDGLTDRLKQFHNFDFGFGISGPNSANPNFSDLVLYLGGITTPSQGLLYCPSNLQTSRSNDAIIYTDPRTTPPSVQFIGLRDCEKLYIGLNPAFFDNDKDGIPDYLELRNGLNPLNINDASVSIAGDSVTNLEKVKRGIPIDENANSQPNQLFASNYKVIVQPDGSRMFNVTNIPVLNGGQDNFIAFYLTESDATTQQNYLFTAYAILRAGAAGQNFKFPFWGTVSTLNDPSHFSQEIIF